MRSSLALLALTTAVAAQAPDILLPSGNLDGIYRLVDRNGNGDYLDDGDAYDYVLNGVDSSIRNVVLVPGSPPRLYCTSTILEQVLSFWDQNGDGVIDATTELTVALDLPSFFGAVDQEVNHLAHAGNGVLFFTNNSGVSEGIWRCEDLNSDGDFADTVLGVAETRPAAVEPSTLVVSNAPNSGNPATSLGSLDSVEFDPSFGANGRFICEEENFDFTIALEDKNGDGDFTDPTEAYLFSALYNGGTIGPDANPDVSGGLLPVSNEIFAHAVDTSTTPTTYYLLSFDTTATQLDAAIVFKGIDRNADGDVNDAGEVTVFWDGSLDSTGAVAAYNFCYGLHAQGGVVWVTAEWDGTTDHEQLVRLVDLTADGDANDVGETAVLWDLPRDLTHYDPLVIAAGILPAPPAGLPGTYDYFGAATCATSLPGLHNVQIGSTNWNDKPVIGSSTFTIRTWGANISSPGVYNIAFSALNPPLPIDPPANTCNVYLLPIASFGFTTDATGQNNSLLAIPNDVGLIGAQLDWQSIVLDPISSLSVTTSDAAHTRFGTYSYSIN